MNGRAIEVTAAASGAFGVVAVVTRSSWAALGAGLSAVVVAGLVLRRASVESSTTAAGEPDPVEDPVTADRSRLLAPALVGPSFEARVAVARRALRPVSMVLFELTIENAEGGRRLGRDVIAAAAEVTLREADVVGRDADGTFVLILEDTGEDGAVWTAERLRRHVLESVCPVRFVAGVATYPNHGLDADAVRAKARAALADAREWGRDRIEVASGT